MSKQVQCCKCDETCPIHHTSDNIPEDAKPYLEFRSRIDSAAPDLLAALKDVMTLIEDGSLVRDISRDNDPDWFMKSVQLIKALKQAQFAIDYAEGKL